MSRLRFSRDGRLRDVIAALDSSHPLLLSGPGLALHEADPELPAKQQQQLLAAALRTMSLPLGRGAVALATGGYRGRRSQSRQARGFKILPPCVLSQVLEAFRGIP